MKFLYPHFLWLLILVPGFYGGMLLEYRRKKAAFERFAQPEVWKVIAPELDFEAKLRKAKLWCAASFFLILTLARPQWGTHEESVKVTGLDVMITLDVSNSMEVEDVVPSRLKKAKHLIRTMLDRLEGDRVGVVAFAAGSYMACPLTTDTDYVREQVELQTPKMVVNQGTDIGLALETAVRALDRSAEQATEKTENAPMSRVIVVISDGEDHEEKIKEAAQKIKASGARLYAFGVGTEKGAPIPTRDDAGQLHGYKRDRKGAPVISGFKPDSLKQLASLTGGKYWDVTAGEGEVDEMLRDMGALNRTDLSERKFVVFEDRFQYPLAIAIVLLLLELSVPARRVSPKALALLLVVASLVGGGEAQAKDLLKKDVPLGAYLENEKGLKAFEEGKIDEARKNFGSAQALNPALPELQYNQGVVQMQQGEVDSAIQGFDSAARGALQKDDPQLAGEALFNLGGALSKKGDVGNAIRAYSGAIGAAQKSGNEALEKDARKNIELLVRQMQQQKQKQQQDQKDKKDQQQQGQDQQQQDQQNQQGGDNPQDQQKQDQQGQDKKDQKNSQDPKDQKDQQQVQQPSKNKKNQFRSQKLTKEDAERVMAELSNREKELRARLNRQKGQPQGQQKDW